MTKTATALARAKVNLCLHVTGRRDDGYHLLDSLVVFPQIADVITAEVSAQRSLTLAGPFAQDLSGSDDNLVLQAAALMPGSASVLLEKNLPIAAGIGGGSADAAATLKALARLTGAGLPPAGAVSKLGADVPVCLAGHAARMRGIGDIIDTLPALPAFWCVLVNPKLPCATADVFRSLKQPANPGLPALPDAFVDAAALFDYLHITRNDLQPAAIAIRPEIEDVLTQIASTPDCALARMSGSGATCFGVYATGDAALAAAQALRDAYPKWWVAAAPVSDDAGDDEIGKVGQDIAQL